MGEHHDMAPMDGGPPPLEDCSEQLSGARLREEVRAAEEQRQREWEAMQRRTEEHTQQREEKEDPTVSSPAEAILKGGRVAREMKAKKEADAAESRAKGTCGFKKGFFEAPKPKKKAAARNNEIEVLRPKEKPKPKGHIEGFEIPPAAIDVTASQVNSVLEMKDKPTEEWMSPELLQAIIQEPDLIRGFQDPEIQSLMAEISKDPAVVEKHRGNKKLMKFYE